MEKKPFRLHVDMNAFNGCSSLKVLNYGGTEEMFLNIVFNTGNDAFIAAYYGIEESAE